MARTRFRSYFPRSLYGRAALTLVVPVIALQLVVSVVFIQRHFEGVTVQMSNSFAREVQLVLATEPAARPALAQALDIQMAWAEGPAPPDARSRIDLTGGNVTRALRARLPQVQAVVLPDMRLAQLYLQTPDGLLRLDVDRRRLSANNPHQLFVNMFVFGGLLTLIAYLYLRKQLRPITRLARVAEAFGKGQNLPYRPAGAIEVRAAGRAFLEMRARIERFVEQRTLMLSGVSHDLRTPLTRLRLGLSLIEGEDTRDLQRDLDEMQQMLDAFLVFARDASEGEAAQTDPIALVRDLIADHRREGHEVSLLSCEGQGEVLLRPVAIRRALDNLIGNAVRYGSRAEVSVSLGERQLRIRVEDDGPGIAADQRDEATKPFTRLDQARNQNRGSGVGLGLAIAADIARAHGGALQLGTSARLGGLRADLLVAR